MLTKLSLPPTPESDAAIVHDGAQQMTYIKISKTMPMGAVVAGFTLAMLAMTAIADEKPLSLEEMLSLNKFECGNTFVTLPIVALDTDSWDFAWMTVRKSDVIGIVARGHVDRNGNSVLVRANVAVESITDGAVGILRRIRIFGLRGDIYDDVVTCLD